MNKTIIKLFTLDEFEKEENWLNEMSEKGMELIKARFIGYTFRPREKNKYQYKIIFYDKAKSGPEWDDFMEILSESGIEVVSRYFNWLYLKKENDGTPFQMFNTVREELAHVNKIKKLSAALLILESVRLVMEIASMMISGHIALSVPTVMVALVWLLVFKVNSGLKKVSDRLFQQTDIYQ